MHCQVRERKREREWKRERERERERKGERERERRRVRRGEREREVLHSFDERYVVVPLSSSLSPPSLSYSQRLPDEQWELFALMAEALSLSPSLSTSLSLSPSLSPSPSLSLSLSLRERSYSANGGESGSFEQWGS
jgi:hypothetical protein